MSDFDQRPPENRQSPYLEAIKSQLHVLYALILHDIKSRFFGNGLGYVVTILWPSTHIAVIVGLFVLTGRTAPFGNSTLIYATTGVMPYIAWNYISRFMQMAIMANKQYLNYPVVKFLDILIARALLEINSVFIISLAILILYPIFGYNSFPIDPEGAALAMLSAICLGVGFGFLASVITRIFPLFMLVYVLVLITFWFSAGVAVNPEGLPNQVGDIIAWNPLLHSIEWLRKSYFIDTPTRLLDKAYVFECAFGAATLGLIGSVVLRPFYK